MNIIYKIKCTRTYFYYYKWGFQLLRYWKLRFPTTKDTKRIRGRLDRKRNVYSMQQADYQYHQTTPCKKVCPCTKDILLSSIRA